MSSIKLGLNSALRAAAHVSSSKLPKELIKSSAAFLSSAPSGGKHTLPDLPYDYDALQCACILTTNLLVVCFVVFYINGRLHSPSFQFSLVAVISAETMEIHHSKHHNTYVTNLNVALEKLDTAVSAGDVSGIIGLQGALKFNGGGHLNHTLFWENLAPTSELKDGLLKDLIVECYGDLATLQNTASAQTIAIQGSGWGWLGYNPLTGTYTNICFEQG